MHVLVNMFNSLKSVNLTDWIETGYDDKAVAFLMIHGCIRSVQKYDTLERPVAAEFHYNMRETRAA